LEEKTMKVLFVCAGNSGRSPMAAEIARREIERRGYSGVVIDSAGIWPHMDTAEENAIAVAREQGGDLSEHRPTQLTPEMLADADHVLVMEESLMAALSQHPPDFTWGCTLLDGDGEYGDVFWFSCQHELVSWFSDGDFHRWSLDEPMFDPDRESLRRLAEEVATDPWEPEELLKQLSHYLHDTADIEWLGTFEELCSGDTSRVSELRRGFRLRGTPDHPAPSRELTRDPAEPIKPEERELFAAFVSRAAWHSL
jgi:protein-tyrosine-phosphatase